MILLALFAAPFAVIVVIGALGVVLHFVESGKVAQEPQARPQGVLWVGKGVYRRAPIDENRVSESAPSEGAHYKTDPEQMARELLIRDLARALPYLSKTELQNAVKWVFEYRHSSIPHVSKKNPGQRFHFPPFDII